MIGEELLQPRHRNGLRGYAGQLQHDRLPGYGHGLPL